jgi:hypothetical protein
MPLWVQNVKQGRASPIGTTMHISLLQQSLATEKSEKGSEKLKVGLFMVKKGIILVDIPCHGMNTIPITFPHRDPTYKSKGLDSPFVMFIQSLPPSLVYLLRIPNVCGWECMICMINYD